MAASGPARQRPARQRPARQRPARDQPRHDPARAVCLDLLRAVEGDAAFANLTLPRLISAAGLDGRDAALATELGYGTLRATGTLDAILTACVDRPLSRLDRDVLLLLRLGAYQLLRTRIPDHAAVASTVELARAERAGRAAGLVNAVLRRVAARGWDDWVDVLAAGASPLRTVALRTAHPEWIVSAFADALGEQVGDLTSGRDGQTVPALAADNERPLTHLVAWPGLVARDVLLAEAGGEPGPYSPYAVRMSGGDPAALAAVAERRAAVQDEGSQLCALALAGAPLDGRDERWLDLCAGPGGKTALLAALAVPRRARVTANELRPHRAELVRSATAAWEVEVRVGDARQFSDAGDGYDRVLVDAPCTGLGALRRRPEARWRRTEADVAGLALLQRELLGAALALARPGAVVAYVTCSPHHAETSEVVQAAAGSRTLIDIGRVLDLPDAAAEPAGRALQLWPHRHGTDAMYCALIRA